VTDPTDRLVAIDWMRGFVMLLMAIDHGSAILNGGRLAHDSVWDLSVMGVSGNEGALGVAQFLTRWITHLCAPTFLFLSGTSLALSTARRADRGDPAGAIDRHLAIRGLVLIGFEVAWMSPIFSAASGRYLAFLQVLFSIGLSLVLMVPLRRLSPRALAAVAIGWFAVGEAVTFATTPPTGGGVAPLSLLLAPFAWHRVAVLYPALPWLAMMMLGWAFGARLVARRDAGRGASPAWICAVGGAASLCLFAAVRAWNGYGNMGLLRRDDSLVEWLHVSKYPPSLAFASLELGVMGVGLAGLFLLQQRVTRPWRWNPILVIGQTALFFYLIHIHLIGVVAAALGRIQAGGLPEAWAAGFGAVLVLYPPCAWYRGYKARHPDGFAQYV
jgi:uncharacterized membrane protein